MRAKREAMQKEYDDYFSKMAQLKKRDLQPKERLKLLDDLHKALIDWGTDMFPGISFDLWDILDGGSHMTYEELMKCPTYVRRDFAHWSRLRRWHELNEELSSGEGLPTLNDLK